MDINVTLSVLWTLLVFLFICGVVNSVQHSNGNGDGSVLRIFYDRDFLLSLKDKVYNPYTEVLTSDSVLASENNTKKKKKQEKRIKRRCKKQIEKKWNSNTLTCYHTQQSPFYQQQNRRTNSFIKV